jgi:hypothetical protein
MLRQKWERKGKGAKENTRKQSAAPHMPRPGLQVKNRGQHGVHFGQNVFGQVPYRAPDPLVGKGSGWIKEDESVFFQPGRTGIQVHRDGVQIGFILRGTRSDYQQLRLKVLEMSKMDFFHSSGVPAHRRILVA